MAFEKSITYVRESRDWEVCVDGRVIGFVSSYLAGEEMANEYVYSMLNPKNGFVADVAQEDAPMVLEATVPTEEEVQEPTIVEVTPIAAVPPSPRWIESSFEALQVTLVILEQRWHQAVVDGNWAAVQDIETRQLWARRQLKSLCGAPLAA